MAKPFHKTKEFLKLKKEWDEKLEKAEFDDIDPKDNDDTTVIEPQKFTASNRKRQYDHGSPGYYEMCHAILRLFKFKKEIHKRIFELHTEGKSEREIADIVQKETKRKYDQKSVNYVIKTTRERFIYGLKQ